MKYRILTDEELNHFGDELVQFLIVNGVHGEEWENLNKEYPDKALELVEIFSDQILQKVYEKIKVLEFRSADRLFVFYLGTELIGLIGFQTDEMSTAGFSTPENIHKTLSGTFEGIKYFRSEKGYQWDRETEIHKMIENGCVPSTEEFWRSVQELIQ